MGSAQRSWRVTKEWSVAMYSHHRLMTVMVRIAHITSGLNNIVMSIFIKQSFFCTGKITCEESTFKLFITVFPSWGGPAFSAIVVLQLVMLQRRIVVKYAWERKLSEKRKFWRCVCRENGINF